MARRRVASSSSGLSTSPWASKGSQACSASMVSPLPTQGRQRSSVSGEKLRDRGRPAPEATPGPGLEEAAAAGPRLTRATVAADFRARQHCVAQRAEERAPNAAVEFSDGSRGLVAAVGRETCRCCRWARTDRPCGTRPARRASSTAASRSPSRGRRAQGPRRRAARRGPARSGRGRCGAAPPRPGPRIRRPWTGRRGRLCFPVPAPQIGPRRGRRVRASARGCPHRRVLSLGRRPGGGRVGPARHRQDGAGGPRRGGRAPTTRRRLNLGRGVKPGITPATFTACQDRRTRPAPSTRCGSSGAARCAAPRSWPRARAPRRRSRCSPSFRARIAAACRDAGATRCRLDDAVHHADVPADRRAPDGRGRAERRVGSSVRGPGRGIGERGEWGRRGGPPRRPRGVPLPPGLGPAGASASVRAGACWARRAGSRLRPAAERRCRAGRRRRGRRGPRRTVGGRRGGLAEIARLASQVLEGRRAAADVRLELARPRRAAPSPRSRCGRRRLPLQPYQSAPPRRSPPRFGRGSRSTPARRLKPPSRARSSASTRGRGAAGGRARPADQGRAAGADVGRVVAGFGRGGTGEAWAFRRAREDAPARALVAAFAAARAGSMVVDAGRAARARTRRGGLPRVGAGPARVRRRVRGELWDEVRSDARSRWTEAPRRLGRARCAGIRRRPRGRGRRAGRRAGGSAPGRRGAGQTGPAWRPLRVAVRRATAKHLERRGLGAAETAGVGADGGGGGSARADAGAALQARRGRRSRPAQPLPPRPSPAGGTAAPRGGHGRVGFLRPLGALSGRSPRLEQRAAGRAGPRRRAREAQERETRLAARRRAAAPVGKAAEGAERHGDGGARGPLPDGSRNGPRRAAVALPLGGVWPCG